MQKKLSKIVALALCTVTISTTTLFAANLKDVSTKHWAYNEIMEMQKRGLLVPSSQGEFFPNNYVTYFELSHILAKITGYQDELVNPNMDATLKQQIRDNYTKQKSSIEAYQKNYTYWQKDANEEIAYLLGKGYLKKEDLGKFMSKSTSGSESKRGVRRQEVTAYLVRILHLEETAKKEYKSTGFADESTIEAALRPHVAYCKKLGIIQGNEKNQFMPTEPVTRATLSKMLIDTLKIKEAQTPVLETPAPQEPQTPETPEVTQPTTPVDRGMEGKLTKMIAKGDGGYYIVLEEEPGKVYTYSIEQTAKLTDKTGVSISLATLKSMIDAKDGDVNVTLKVSVVGTSEYVTAVRLMEELDIPPTTETPKVEDNNSNTGNSNTSKEEEEDSKVLVTLEGSIYSILIAKTPEVTIQLNDGTKKTYQVAENAEFYSLLSRREIGIGDLRLDQSIEMDVIGKKIRSLDVIKAAPPVTITGTIVGTSITGDKIEVRVSYDQATQSTNTIKTISVPMSTKIVEGTIQRSRKDFKENMQIVVVYPENGGAEPEQVIILSK